MSFQVHTAGLSSSNATFLGLFRYENFERRIFALHVEHDIIRRRGILTHFLSHVHVSAEIPSMES